MQGLEAELAWFHLCQDYGSSEWPKYEVQGWREALGRDGMGQAWVIQVRL